MERISVVGTTGSGKTTFARALAARLGIPHVELDAINWGPNWTSRPPEEFRRRAVDAIAGDAWVVDGNYGSAGVRSEVWRRADTVIWLDYPVQIVFWRLLGRTLGRIRSGESYWAEGNVETLRGTFLSRDSILIWFFRSYWRRRRQLRGARRGSEYPHLRWLTFRSPRDAERWLEGVRA